MANPEHLRILQQGVEAWNAWRVQNQDSKPDLMGAHLLSADFTRAKLGGGHLSRTDLIRRAPTWLTR